MVDEETALMQQEPPPTRDMSSTTLLSSTVLRPCWILTLAVVGSISLVLGMNTGSWFQSSGKVKSKDIEIAQGAFYWGIDQKKFDLPEDECIKFFEPFCDENIVLDYSGGPCDFLTGIHKGIGEVCTFFKSMDGRYPVTESPETTWFQNGDLVLAKIHGPYVTIPGNKTGIVDEIVAMSMVDGKVSKLELFTAHAKNFVC